jgi:hypothetical protein
MSAIEDARAILADWDLAAAPDGAGRHDAGGFALRSNVSIRATLRELLAEVERQREVNRRGNRIIAELDRPDEWEYGIRPEDDDVPLGISPMPSFDAARTRANNICGGWVIVRRRKAGDWEEEAS